MEGANSLSKLINEMELFRSSSKRARPCISVYIEIETFFNSPPAQHSTEHSWQFCSILIARMHASI